MHEVPERSGEMIQTGLRVPENQYDRIREKAEKTGVSLNSLILILVDIGLNYLDMESDESLRSLPHSRKCTS